MPFIRMFVEPHVDLTDYDRAVKQLGVSTDRGVSVAVHAARGLIVHAAGPGPDRGWRVIEVWDSEEAARYYDERIEPVLKEVGIQRAAPEVWHVHNLIVRGG